MKQIIIYNLFNGILNITIKNLYKMRDLLSINVLYKIKIKDIFKTFFLHKFLFHIQIKKNQIYKS